MGTTVSNPVTNLAHACFRQIGGSKGCTTMFKAAKDAMTSRAAQVYVNNRIARYGEVQTLRINSREKTMEVSCLLHGEKDPITIKVENYNVDSSGAKKYVEATTITCTRPWLQNLLTDFAQNRRVEVPNWAESIL